MILVVGEALVDVVAHHDGTLTRTPGGSPANVATGLARLDVETVLITELGPDADGDLVRRHLGEAGVELVVDEVAHTSRATVHLDPTGHPHYEFSLGWTLPHHALPPCDALHVGSLGAHLQPGRDSVLNLVDQAWSLGVPISYDPNIRAAFLEDPESTWSDVQSVAERSRVVKLSVEDATLLHPGADPEDVARALLTGSETELVVLTRAGAGASAYRAGLTVDRPPPATTVIDTVGAGDGFMAGLLAALSLDDYDGTRPLPEDPAALALLLDAAMAAAAVSCSRPGADPAWRSELPPTWPA